MKGIRKRIVSIVIAIMVIMTMNVMPAFAAETSDPAGAPATDSITSAESAPAGEETIVEDTTTYTYTQDTGAEAADNDALFEQYVEAQLFTGVDGYGSSKLKISSVYLSDIDQRIYNKLKSQIAEVAAGNITSTEFTVSVSDMGLAGMKWTAADLGVSQLAVNGRISSEAIEALRAQLGIDLDRVLDALLAETPYEYYWYDKTAGVAISGPGFHWSSSSDGEFLSIGSGYTFSFSVAESYAAGEYEVDNTNITRVNQAVDKAQDIVSEAAASSDEEKLIYYREQICDLVSYDTAAAGGTTPYGDQWQLISVFDGDDTTNVVCEGYSKAFKYLCDLTEFTDPKLECILVSGTMSGATGEGAHMWNVVCINGLNFLVDVTNCDEGTVGWPDQLFLAGTGNGDAASGYTFRCDGGNIFYAYDNDTKGLYDEELNIYSEDYNGTLAYIPKEVESITFEAFPRLRKDVDAGLSATAFSGDTVTLHYNDGTSEKYYFDASDWKFKTENGITTEESDRIVISYDSETHVDFAAYYNGEIRLRDDDPSASFVAKSIDFEQAEPVRLIKGVHSTTATDAQGNEYEEYSLSQNIWFKADDKFSVIYENGLGETIDVAYVYDEGTGGFTLAEGSDYYTGFPSDNYFGNSFEVNLPDQSVNHFEVGDTYGISITYHEYGSNFDLTPITSADNAYQVLIKEAGPEDVTSVSFTNSSPARMEKGSTLQLTVKWNPAYAVVPTTEITWASADPAVATVDDNGLVTAVSEGSTQITAQIGAYRAVKNITVWEKKVFTDENISLSQTVFPYTGSNVDVAGKVLYNGISLEPWNCSMNYSNRPLNIGEYTVTISGWEEGGYYGSATETFRIKGNLAGTQIVPDVTLDSSEDYVYTGEPVEPTVTSVVFANKTLTEGVDYTVSYANNEAVGTGYVIITAVEDGNYMGEKRIPFKIADLKTGWVQDENGNWTYYRDGSMLKNTWEKDSKGWCYLSADGTMAKNTWVKDSKGWCYVGSDGYMVTNSWKKDSKGWCYVGSDGHMVTNGWAKDSKGWCWMGADGYWVSNKWIQSGGQWYYIKSNHYMAANEWAKDSGGWMYMDAGGKITKSKWIKSGGYWYYLKSDGYMATGTQKIGGKTYKFDSAGRWVS